MFNLSTWLSELLFAVTLASFSLAELPIEDSDNNKLSLSVEKAITRPPIVIITPAPSPATIRIHTLQPETPPPPVCHIEKIDSGKNLFADCRNKHLSKIPHDFGTKNYPYIKILDLSDNSFKNLGSSDLYNFTSLSELAMRNIPNIHSFPKDFFLHLQWLDKLDISGTQISDFIEMSVYLRVLNATNIQAKNLNLSHLVSLEELYLKDNPQMTNFPLLSVTAPLKHLDVRFSSMINLTYADLAPFCLLKYFGLESSELEKASNASQCCGIKNWTSFFQIPGSENQKCGQGDPCSKINSTLNLDLIAVRNECLKRTGIFGFIKIIIQIFIGVVVASGVLYFCCYNFIWSRGKKDDKDTSYYDNYDTDTYPHYDKSYDNDADYDDGDDYDDDDDNYEDDEYYY